MFDFCASCGQTIEQEEIVGQMLVCIHCGKPIGLVSEAPAPEVETPLPIRSEAATRCPACNQLVEVKTNGTKRTFVPHYAGTEKRKICPQSGKPEPEA